MQLRLVTGELEDGVETEKVMLVMFLFHKRCSALLRMLNRKGQTTLEVLCQGLQVLINKANGKLVLHDMNSINTNNMP